MWSCALLIESYVCLGTLYKEENEGTSSAFCESCFGPQKINSMRSSVARPIFARTPPVAFSAHRVRRIRSYVAVFPSPVRGRSDRSRSFVDPRKRREKKQLGDDYVANQFVSTLFSVSRRGEKPVLTAVKTEISDENEDSECEYDENEVIVSPSIAKADLWDLKTSVTKAVEGGANWLHVSVQDGSLLAPKISLGSPIVSCLRKNVPKNVKLDVKLNTLEPFDRIEEFVNAGADVITFAPESAKQPMAVLQKIKDLAAVHDREILAGIVLNPSTSIFTVEELVPCCDIVVVMLVNAGLGTTPYATLDEQISRVRKVRAYFGPSTRVQIDGGVDECSAKELIKAGADTIVAGSAVFKSNDPKRVIHALKGGGRMYNKQRPR